MRISGRIEYDRSARMYSVQIPLLGIWTQGGTKDECLDMAAAYLEEGYDNFSCHVFWDEKKKGTFIVETTDKKVFGMILRAAREDAGLSLQEAAKLLGYRNHNSVYAYENGSRVPSAEKLFEMLSAYGSEVFLHSKAG